MGIQKRPHKDGKTASYAVTVNVMIDGRSKKKHIGTFHSRRDAKIAFDEANRDVRLHGVPRKMETVSMQALADKFMANKRLRPTTARGYGFIVKRILDELGADTPVSRITHEMADAFAATTRKKYAPGTARNTITQARSMFRSAVRWGYATTNPFDGLVKARDQDERKTGEKAAKRALTRAEVQRIVEAAPEHYRNLYAVWPLIGLRIGEMRGLRWQDVDLDGKKLHVRHQVTHISGGKLSKPKTPSSIRTVNLSAKAVEHLRAQREISKGEFVFVGRSGDMLPAEFCRDVSVFMDSIGLNDVTSHVFRHTFASWLVETGKVTFPYVQGQLGHAHLSETLNLYTHLVPDQEIDPDLLDR